MADRVDTLVQPLEPPDPEPVPNGGLTRSDREKLAPGDHTMLATRQLGDPEVEVLRWHVSVLLYSSNACHWASLPAAA
jgi:hypothetical protein